MTTQNLSLGANVEYTIDPTIPQSSQQSVGQLNNATNEQLALINATTTGGRRRTRRRRRKIHKGGDTKTILVSPLPLGATGENAQANNVAMSSLFANAASASTYDNQVQTAGKRRRRSRRLSTRRRYKRNTKITRRRYKKNRKSMKYRR